MKNNAHHGTRGGGQVFSKIARPQNGGIVLNPHHHHLALLGDTIKALNQADNYSLGKHSVISANESTIKSGVIILLHACINETVLIS